MEDGGVGGGGVNAIAGIRLRAFGDINNAIRQQTKSFLSIFLSFVSDRSGQWSVVNGYIIYFKITILCLMAIDERVKVPHCLKEHIIHFKKQHGSFSQTRMPIRKFIRTSLVLG